MSTSEAISILVSLATLIAGAGTYYGSLRVRLANLEAQVKELDGAREWLKDKRAEDYTSIQLLEQAAGSITSDVAQFRREFRADTGYQNGMLQSLTVQMARITGGRSQTPPGTIRVRDQRTEPDDSVPPGPPRPRRSQTNE
jgi:hypothetical protein